MSADRHSANAWARDPASAAGEVAPACPAESRLIGMPVSTWATMQPADSSAKRNGGTTKVLLAATNGRLRNSPSPPASRS